METILTMHPRKTFVLIVACAIIFSCKKENNNSTSSASQPDCVDQHSLKSGDLIDEQYIVAYKASSLDAHTATFQRISDISREVLQRNKISSSVIETTFQGEPGGFIAHLSPAEMARLKKDADVEAIEPDRIIALSTCFTVAEPRLVTWNVERVGFGDG